MDASVRLLILRNQSKVLAHSSRRFRGHLNSWSDRYNLQRSSGLNVHSTYYGSCFFSSNVPTPPNENVSNKSLVESAPASVRPYLYLSRVDKPIGTMLLLWPCFWSTALAAGSSYPDPQLLLLFSTGSFLMRGAGCTINDMWDEKYDRHVARTVQRPLASGDLTKKQAAVFLVAQLTGGLAVLTSLPHLDYCFWLGTASLPLVFIYPLMKRYTNWPQLVLGMTINWGALMGYAATHGTLDLSVVGPLYGGSVAWTLIYDTLYAHQDKNDDKKLGLKSTALYFGDTYTKPILQSFAAIAACSWMYAGASYIGTTMAWSHLVWQIHTADLHDSDNLAQRFRSNNAVGGIMFLSCIIGN